VGDLESLEQNVQQSSGEGRGRDGRRERGLCGSYTVSVCGVCAGCVCLHPVVFAKSQEESTSFYLAAGKTQRFDYSDFPLM